MSLVEYIQSEYDILDFIEWLECWQKEEQWNMPYFIMTEIPRELLNPYIQQGTYYRGMVIGDGEVWNSEGCSWTLDINVACVFADKVPEAELLTDEGCKDIRSMVYERKGKAVVISDIVRDIKEFINTLPDESWKNRVEKLHRFFLDEGECVWGFEQKDCSIKYSDPFYGGD